MDKNVKKVVYLTPMIFASTAALASEESWTWSQFAGSVAGGAVGGAAGAVAGTAAVAGLPVPGAGAAALAGGVSGAVASAVGYSLTVAFG